MQLQIEMEYDPNLVIPQEYLDEAMKFGMEQIDGIHTNKYIVAFLRKLLLQREKADEGLLENYINPAILKQWQELLSILEDRKRKLTNILSGSLVFSLFCPTLQSRLQLQDKTWRADVQWKTAELLKLLGKHDALQN